MTRTMSVAYIASTLFASCTPPAPQPPAAAPHASAPAPVQVASAQASAPCPAKADDLPASGEGMWPWHDLSALDERALQQRGLRIPLRDLWTPGHGGLLRAVAGMKGCSASFVSADGLLLTNHHCAHRAIQRNSTPEHDYLGQGFVAGTRAEELPGHGTLVYVFRQQTDVTSRVLDGIVGGLTDLERMREVERRESLIVKECESKPSTRCQVARENDGLRFLLLENVELRDVRVVAAPPESLGNYGGEIDNWHWPRHTLDFTVMRAYVSPSGEPADYSPANVPYHPERHLQVSEEFPSPPALVMIAGTPAHTQRYASSTEVGDARSWYYPTREALFAEWIGVMEREAGNDPAAKLAIASWLRRLNNGLFHAKGMLTGLRVNGAEEKARAREAAIRAFVAGDAGRSQRFGTVLDNLQAHLTEARKGRDRDLLLGYLASGAQVFAAARRITRWAAERARPDEAREPGFQDRDRDTIRRELEQSQKSLHLTADREVMRLSVRRLCELPASERPAILSDPQGLPCEPGRLNAKLLELYRTTKLTDAAGRVKAFGSPLPELKKSKDPMLSLALRMQAELDQLEARNKEQAGSRLRVERPYLEALIAWQGKTFYPDANSTPRVSFAHVAGYIPHDGAWYGPKTTFRGMLDKATGKPPFEVPEALRRAHEQKLFGAYADASGADVPLCFLSNGDTTGGNSGSPVLDAEGRMIGLNFDRVYENIAGDYGYNRDRSRNVVVSTRAILWYLEHVARAATIAAEMKGAAR